MPRPAVSDLLAVPATTALPASPVDGQEIYYRFQQSVTPADAKWIVWHLRYDATAAAWLPVGRQDPVHAYYPTFEQVAFSANVWGGIGVNDPLVTVPRQGDYEVEWGVGKWYMAGIGNAYCAAYFPGQEQTANGVQPSDDILSFAGNTSTTTFNGGSSASKKMTLATGNQLRQRYYITGSFTIGRGSAFVKLYPRRITG